MKGIGNAPKQETGRWLNSRAENFHLPFRPREPAPLVVCRHTTAGQRMLRFRQMRSLQKFVAVHASTDNRFNTVRHLYGRPNFKLNRTAALAEWCGLCAA
jgi:putative transposase